MFRIAIIFLFCFLSLLFFIPQSSFADVFVPENEYVGYYDYQGIFTVVGNVKNQNDFALVPQITLSVIDDQAAITKTFEHVPIPPMTDIPFKLKFPEIHGNSPSVLPADLKYVETEKNSIPIQIIYDKTLVTFDDGHVTGRIKNIGNETVYNPKIFAIVHGYDKYILDVAQNINHIEKIEPGEILNFSIYPDPSVSEPVRFYSCFAPVDTTVIPVTVKKNDGDYDFRYDSGAWYSAAKFSDDGTTLTMRGYNSYPLETYANFEFTPISGKEKFSVMINDKPIDFIQSIDEMGQWHVAYTVGPQSQGVVKITGFEKGLPPEIPSIPQWVKENALWWSNEQISDSKFLEGIDFLFQKGEISVASKDITEGTESKVPSWFKITVNWWSEGKITDNDFLNAVENLLKREIIVI